MKLVTVQITNFRSVEDSDIFDVSDLTCLVGKNEAGKSAILDALYGLNAIESHNYDQVIDYPRRFFTEFNTRHPSGEARVVNTIWKLESSDIELVEESLGQGCLKDDEINLSHGFGYNTKKMAISIDQSIVMKKAAEVGGCDLDETKKFLTY